MFREWGDSISVGNEAPDSQHGKFEARLSQTHLRHITGTESVSLRESAQDYLKRWLTGRIMSPGHLRSVSLE